MLKKKVLSILVVFTILIFVICSSCYAAIVEVTRENLTETFKSMISSEILQESISNIEVDEDTISCTSELGQYEMKYDLTDEPTFEIEMNIKDGMTYDEYEKEQAKMQGPMIGYIAVANLNNVQQEQALFYIVMTYISLFPQNGEYIIYDDRESDFTGDVSSDGKQVIKASEFGDYAMDYINSIYSQTVTINDELDTFEIKIEKQEVTDTSCKIVERLTVKKEADFSKIIENVETPSDDEQQEEQQPEQEETPQEETQKPTNNINSQDKTTATRVLPKAGINIAIYITLGVLIILVIIFRIKYKMLKDVK